MRLLAILVLLNAIVGATAAATPGTSLSRPTGVAAKADGTVVIEKFLARPFVPTQYRAMRRLEATGSGQRGWLDAQTAFSPAAGMQYEVTSEGGSGLIRSRVLRSLLQQEKELIATGSADSVAIDRSNYTFSAGSVTPDGLVPVTLQPLRKHRALIAGTMFLAPDDGDLVRVEGRLAKNPSFWLRKVDVVRSYARINGVLVPLSLQSTAQVRFLGGSSLRMTYHYTEIDNRAVSLTH
jgi:hypothetical protein